MVLLVTVSILFPGSRIIADATTNAALSRAVPDGTIDEFECANAANTTVAAIVEDTIISTDGHIVRYGTVDEGECAFDSIGNATIYAHQGCIVPDSAVDQGERAVIEDTSAASNIIRSVVVLVVRDDTTGEEEHQFVPSLCLVYL